MSARPAKRARTGSHTISPTAAMIDYLEAHGARFGPTLCFRASQPGAGVGGFAARDIHRGETVCAIPLRLAITSTEARIWWYRHDGEDKDAGAQAAEPSFIDDEFLLCMYLIAARRKMASVPPAACLYAAALSCVAPDTCSDKSTNLNAF